jgi:hypothetical protein
VKQEAPVVEKTSRERGNILVWRILRWYLLVVEVLLMVYGVYLLTTGKTDDRTLGLFCLLLGGIALVSHVIASIAMRRNQRRS